MAKDGSERRTYRKSPGRQYGYDYDPLRSGNEEADDTTGERHPTRYGTQKSGPLSAPRPDPRRTRKLVRQSILASKGRSTTDEEITTEQQEEFEPRERRIAITDEEQFSPQRYPTRNRPVQQPPYVPVTRELDPNAQEEYEDYNEDYYEDVDPDAGYDEEVIDPLADRAIRTETVTPNPPSARNSQRIPTRVPTRSMRPLPEEEYEDDYYEDEEEEDARPVRRRRKKVSRRGLLIGLGATAAIGTGVAAYEVVPKIPQALNNAGANIERQLQDAFNKGVAQGAEAARKEFVTTLENLEGVSLDGAINAAALTRVAYDTFVAPIVSFGANLAADFLSTMLQAFRSARGFLQAAGQDNATLASIQKVLEAWVGQVSNLPKQLNAITDADLDGAQAYLRKLKATVEAEKAKLNSSPSAKPTAQPTPKK